MHYVTRSAHGPFPAGTPCVAWRARPDSFIVLEFEDGSVAEVTYGYLNVELEPSWFAQALAALMGSITVAHDEVLLARVVHHVEGL